MHSLLQHWGPPPYAEEKSLLHAGWICLGHHPHVLFWVPCQTTFNKDCGEGLPPCHSLFSHQQRWALSLYAQLLKAHAVTHLCQWNSYSPGQTCSYWLLHRPAPIPSGTHNGKCPLCCSVTLHLYTTYFLPLNSLSTQ